MMKPTKSGSAKRRSPEEKGGMNRQVEPVKLRRRVVADLPLLYRALAKVLVRDGILQLVGDDTQSDRKKE